MPVYLQMPESWSTAKRSVVLPRRRAAAAPCRWSVRSSLLQAGISLQVDLRNLSPDRVLRFTLPRVTLGFASEIAGDVTTVTEKERLQRG